MLGEEQRSKDPRVSRIRELSTDLRNEEGKAVHTSPPVAGIVAVRVEPAVTAAAIRVQEARAAIRILDRFVHGNNPPETHSLNIVIRKHFPDETGNFRVWSDQLPINCQIANVLRDASLVFEQHSLENRNLARYARGRLELP